MAIRFNPSIPMRRLLTLLVLFVPVLSAAQQFGASVGAGLVASQLDGDHYAGYHKLGFSLGADVNRLLVADRLGARLGLRYVRKGSHQEATEDTPFYKSELHYAEMPLTAFYRWRKFDFEAGLAFGYLIKAKEDTDGYGLREPNIDFNRYELSAIAGVRYQLAGPLWAHACLNYSALSVRRHHVAQDGHKISGQHNNAVIIGVNVVLK